MVINNHGWLKDDLAAIILQKLKEVKGKKNEVSVMLVEIFCWLDLNQLIPLGKWLTNHLFIHFFL